MTRNQIDALRNQEVERHNKETERQDRIWRPVEAVSGAIGSIGSLARGFGSWRNAGPKSSGSRGRIYYRDIHGKAKKY